MADPDRRASSSSLVVWVAVVALGCASLLLWMLWMLWPRAAPDEPPPRAEVVQRGVEGPPQVACPSSFFVVSVGQLLDGWRVTRIELRPREGRVLARRGDDEVEFAFSGPAGSAPSGPFDSGSMRLYPRDANVALAAFTGLGEALAGMLAAGVDSEDPGPWIDDQLELARGDAPRCEDVPARAG